jgi:anaerobic magnesium-protoporphyrin IX monomethyl ester cyclase
MKVSLVVPADPPGVNAFNQVPIGGLYTATQLRDQGDEVTFFDLRRRTDLDAAYAEVAFAELAVTFSTDYDLAQCYPSLTPAAECVRRIKAAAGPVPVVCCGSHATVSAALTRSFTGADGVILGEFEFAVPALVRQLRSGAALPDVWPLDGTPRVATEAELAALRTPAYDLVPMHGYASEGFVDGEMRRVSSGIVLANRGCPFGCNFCYLFFGRRLRRRPVAATLEELRTLRNEYGIGHFFFLDYTFTLDESWVQSLCDGINAAGLDISWICQTRVDRLSTPKLKLMKEAGCAGVWLGVESPELEQRRYLSKGRIAFEDIEEGVSKIREAGIEVLTFVMVGLPSETESSLRSLNAWLESSQVYYSLSTFQRRLGTPLAKEVRPMAADGWEHFDAPSEFLGESRLRIADLSWFTEFHATNPRRVANIMRRHREPSG